MNSKSLFMIEVISTAFSYKIFNEITENSWLETVELSSGANAKNLLVFQTSDFQKLKILAQRLDEKYGQPSRRILEIFSPQIFDVALIENAHPTILLSMSALTQNAVEGSVLVFEIESICGAIRGLDLALKNHQLKLCDLRLMRQSGGMNHAFLTGTAANCQAASEAIKQLMFANYMVGQVEVIEAPTSQFKEMFGFAL